MAISLEILTDEAILDYTRDEGKDRILTDHRDINLQHDGISAWPGGVYDVMAFGSPMEDRCICGYTHRKPNEPSTEPCPRCGARVFSREDGLRRFARIELPFYYLNELRFEVFKSFFDDVFSGSEIKLDFMGDDLKRNGYSSARGGKKLGIKVFDTCQFTYSATKKRLTISEFITDLDKCSYEGIMAIIEKHFPDRLNEYKKLINRYYLVLPVMMRPFSLTRDKDGTKKMGTHKLSTWYSSIIYFCVSEDKKANQVNYEETINSFKTPGEKARYNALLRAYLNVGKKEATTLLNTSKKNAARQLYAVRTPNSARCFIVPSTTLAIDEIGVPTPVAYEMCREGFIKHLMNELNFTEKEARKATKEEALNPETQKMFKEYAEKQIVLN